MKHFRIICLAAAALTMAGCGNNAAKKAAEEEALKAAQDSIAAAEARQKTIAIEEKIKLLADEPVFVIETSLGTIKVKLYKKTPLHRANFEKLALGGYYDGLLFHRVIDGFMIQGGDPLTKDPDKVDLYGTGGPEYTIPAEFIPEYKHKKGALAAARRGDAANPMKESSGSQFYLVQSPEACAALDGDYTVYGETIEGLDVIDKIAAVPTNRKGLPANPVKIISVKLDQAFEPAPAPVAAEAAN